MENTASQNAAEAADQSVDRLLSEPGGFKALSTLLEKRGIAALRHLESMEFPAITDKDRLADARKGIIIDVETTGGDPLYHQVIQLAMLEIVYDGYGILNLGRAFSKFQDPGRPIPLEIRRLTGITDNDVKGQVIEIGEVQEFVAGSKIVIAHNAGFDRKFVETGFPEGGFNRLNWYCSLKGVDWATRIPGSRSLEILALKTGFVYGAHQAENDVRAVAFALSFDSTGERTEAFREMLLTGAKNTVRVVAADAPWEMPGYPEELTKNLLKKRGYRWSGSGAAAGGTRAWYRDVADDPATLAQEAAFLRDMIYGGDRVLPRFTIKPLNRFSGRLLDRASFDTADYPKES